MSGFFKELTLERDDGYAIVPFLLRLIKVGARINEKLKNKVDVNGLQI